MFMHTQTRFIYNHKKEDLMFSTSGQSMAMEGHKNSEINITL